MKYILSIIIALFLLSFLYSQDSVDLAFEEDTLVVEEYKDLLISKDSSSVQWRAFKEENLSKYRNNKDYYYGIQAQYEEGFFSRLWSAIKNWYRDLIGAKNEGRFWKFIEWVVAIGGIFILVRFLMTTTGVSMFRKEEKVSDLQMHLTKEDLQQNLLEQIEKAEHQGDFRLAIRFHFLQMLKYLDANDLIHFKEHKTNSDYYYEIKNQELKKGYAAAANVYDYAWYGKFEINADSYPEVSKNFKNIYNSKTSA